MSRAESGSAIGEVPDSPILRIETGMHGAMINRIAIAAGGSEIITVSDDKTARRWSTKDGKALSVLRGPIGDGDEGALYAVAAAGRLVAVGGRTGFAWDGVGSVYLFHRESGRLLGRISAQRAPVTALAISPDKRFLAVGLRDRGGLKVYDLKALDVAFEDRWYEGSVTWLDFDRSGRLVSAAADGLVRLYSERFDPLGRVRLPGGRTPWSVAFSPDGREVAVGNRHDSTVDVLSGRDLEPVRSLRGVADHVGSISVVAWSADGRFLYGAGTYREANERRLVRRWSTTDASPPIEFPVGDDTVTDLAPLPDGRLVYAGAEAAWGVTDAAGRPVFARGRAFADFRGVDLGAFAVSHDGSVVDFGYRLGGAKPARFDLVARRLSVDPPPRADLRRPRTRVPGLDLEEWRNSPRPLANGRPVALEPNEIARSAAIAPDGAGFALGTDFYLRYLAGGEEKWRTVVPAPAWGVNISGDGRFVLAALGDGTIRWYLSGDGAEMLALFPHRDGKRWIAWTPEGFFDHSGNAGPDGSASLIGYHLNGGRSEEAEFIRVGQLYGLFYRRDLMMMKFRDGHGAGNDIATQLGRIGDIRTVLGRGLPPRVALQGYCEGASGGGCRQTTRVAAAAGAEAAITVTGSRVVLRLKLEDRGGGIGDVVLRRNGAAVESKRVVVVDEKGVRTEDHEITLGDGVNRIVASAFTARGDVEAKAEDRVAVTVTVERPRPAGAERDETVLYILAVGISDYSVDAFDLENAARDAEAVTAIMKTGAGAVYDRVVPYLLTDARATFADIQRGFDEIAARARPRDMVMVFLAGHGEAVDGRYYFAPYDFAVGREDMVRRAAAADKREQERILYEIYRLDGFDQSKLTAMLKRVQAGRVIVLLDTCYSSALATQSAAVRKDREDTWVNTLGNSTGRFILASSTGLALDASLAGETDPQGLFTTHLLKALAGRADFDRNRRVNIYELATYTERAVLEESGRLQQPAYYFVGSRFFDVRGVSEEPG